MRVQGPHDDVGYLLNVATRRFRSALAESLRHMNLTPQQAAALMAIEGSEGGSLTPRELAESIGADQATTSGLLQRLVRGGWLLVADNPDDGRSRLLGLTHQAEVTLPHVREAARRVSTEATACLSLDELGVLSGLLAKLCAGTAEVDE